METQNLVISFDYSWFLAKNLAYAERRIMKFHYRNSSNVGDFGEFILRKVFSASWKKSSYYTVETQKPEAHPIPTRSIYLFGSRLVLVDIQSILSTVHCHSPWWDLQSQSCSGAWVDGILWSHFISNKNWRAIEQ